MNKPELLMPAGDLEKAKIAYQFGADACYGSTSAFSMRTREIGFDYKTLKEAIDYAHLIKKRFYVTLNTFPHEFELGAIKKHAKKLISMNPDAIILADAGILSIVMSVIARSKSDEAIYTNSSRRNGSNHKIEIHLSTQANTTNSESIKFWAKQGVSRFVLARELSLKEIIEIRKNVPKKIKLEAFVHGAMCMSVSGRCHLSNYLTGRDANRGVCAQVCRWGFAVSEEKRAGQYMPVEEDHNYSYIYNAKDLNMIEHLDKLAKAGIDSFKVEGRNKSIYYCAIVARAYRKAIDALFPVIARSHQQMGTKQSGSQIKSGMTKDRQIAASQRISALAMTENTYLAEGRGEIFPGDKIEIVTPDKIIKMKLKELISPKGIKLEKINPSHEFVITSKENIPINSIIRTKKEKLAS